MENTLENKEKFFAQYYGQKVGYHDKFSGWIIGGVIRSSKIEYLELTSLKDITDEDAAHICDMAGYSTNDFFKKVELGKQLLKEYLTSSRCNVQPLDWLQIFDYLRSKGYLVPWMGLSTEEIISRGWAKTKE